jgi:hypothetical protein
MYPVSLCTKYLPNAFKPDSNYLYVFLVLALLVTNIKMVGYQQFPNYVILWLTDLSPPGKGHSGSYVWALE